MQGSRQAQKALGSGAIGKAKVVFDKPALSRHANMSHSFAQPEQHPFKHDLIRRHKGPPAQDGVTFDIEVTGFGLPLAAFDLETTASTTAVRHHQL